VGSEMCISESTGATGGVKATAVFEMVLIALAAIGLVASLRFLRRQSRR
jgi:hypothetical protein